MLEAPAIAGMVVLSILAHIFTPFDFGSSQLPIRVLVAALSILPFFLVLAIAHRIARAFPKQKVLLVLAAYMIGGGVRGILLEIALANLGVITSENELLRFPASTLIVSLSIITLCAVTISYAWSTIQDHRARLAELQSEISALRDAYQRLSKQSGEELQLRATELSRFIMLRLAEINSVAGQGAKEELQELVDSVVRPLSQRLAQEVPTWKPSREVPTVSLYSVLREITPERHLPALSFSIGSVVAASVASSAIIFGFELAILLFFVFSIGLVLARFFVYPIINRYFGRFRSPLRETMLTLGFLLIAAPPAFGSMIALQGTSRSDAFVIPTFVAVPVLGWLILIGNSAREQSLKVSRELELIQRKLRWHIARINLLAWYQQGLTSRMMHGPIQNAIHVGILRLKTLDNEEDAGTVIRSIIQRIESVIELLSNQIPSNPQSSLKAIAITWEGVAKISSQGTDEVMQSLDDPATAGILQDLIQEACSNAIRHGGASEIKIYLESKPGKIHVRIEDNGKKIESTGRKGLGTQFREACSLSSSLQRVGLTNILTIDLPASEYQELDNLDDSLAQTSM